MKHIALVLPAIDRIGGAERQVLLLARELSARGWRVSLIALAGAGGDALQGLAEANVAYLSLGMRKAWIDPRGWLRYLRWAALNRPQIVHAHLPHATWFARWVRLLTPVRVLVDTIHTTQAGGTLKRLGYRISHWSSDHVTCVSQSVAEAAAGASIVSIARMIVIPNGVIIPPLRPRVRHALATFLWIAVGRLAPVKDYPTLLRAFAALEGQPRLLIAGEGPDELALRQLAVSLYIDDRVQFAGFQSDLQPLLAAADAFVLSSLWEGLPLSVIEAQAAGLPVVATEAPGTAEAMLPNTTGILAPIGDPAALAHAMGRIMAMSGEERCRMGSAGREFVEQNFSLVQVAGRWESIYNGLLEANPSPTRWASRKRRSLS